MLFLVLMCQYYGISDTVDLQFLWKQKMQYYVSLCCDI